MAVKVFVTGADGLLGSNLVRELLERGDEVRVLLQPGRKTPTLDGLPLERIEHDLLADGDGLARAAEGREAVFHCAAVTSQWAPADLTWRVNRDGTKKVLDASLAAGVRRLVAVGSASSYQFGTRELPGDETAHFPPAHRGLPYMESKHEAAELVRRYVAEKNLDAVIAAPTFMLGRYDAAPSSGELMAQFINRGLRFATPGGRNFAHVRDVARAMVSAHDRGKKGETYILGGENLTYLDFFTRVARAVGMPPPAIVLPRAAVLAGGAVGSLVGALTGRQVKLNRTIARLSLYGTYYSSAKAVAELGMSQTPVDEAIADELASLREYGHIKK